MKFPRNARLLRSQLDATPFASVFFLLVIFVMLGSLVYMPGVPIQLPVADDLPGTDTPTVAVAMDGGGRLYFENQLIDEGALMLRLQMAATNSREPLTLVIQADKTVAWEKLERLMLHAREAGIHNFLGATLPRVITAPREP